MSSDRFKRIRERQKQERFQAAYAEVYFTPAPAFKKRREWPLVLGFVVFGLGLFWLLWTIYAPCDGPNPPAYCQSCEGTR